MPFVAYVKFAAAHRRLIAFGFLAAFASSFGQTYYIGVFGPAIQSEFGLSHTAWGTIYMLGTLGSAALLPWTGKQIDRLDLRLYTALVGLLAVVASAATALTINSAMLVVARKPKAIIVLVDDDDMRDAARWLWFEMGLGVELSAGAAVAALRTGAYRASRDENLCAIVCGSGTDGFE